MWLLRTYLRAIHRAKLRTDSNHICNTRTLLTAIRSAQVNQARLTEFSLGGTEENDSLMAKTSRAAPMPPQSSAPQPTDHSTSP